MPHFAAALQASLLAVATLLLVLQLIGIVAYDESAWQLLRAIVAVLRGQPDTLDDPGELDLALIALGLALFYAVWTGARAYCAFRRG